MNIPEMADQGEDDPDTDIDQLPEDESEAAEEEPREKSRGSRFVMKMTGFQVNSSGFYYLHLLVKNADHPDHLSIEVGQQGHTLQSHEIYTGVMECKRQRPPAYTALPAELQYLTFFFPDGFSNREKEEMYVLVELHEVIYGMTGRKKAGNNKSGASVRKTKLVAKAMVHPFPPDVKHDTSDEARPAYTFSKVLVFSRRLSCANMCMQCGRLKMAGELHHSLDSQTDRTVSEIEEDKVSTETVGAEVIHAEIPPETMVTPAPAPTPTPPAEPEEPSTSTPEPPSPAPPAAPPDSEIPEPTTKPQQQLRFEDDMTTTQDEMEAWEPLLGLDEPGETYTPPPQFKVMKPSTLSPPLVEHTKSETSLGSWGSIFMEPERPPIPSPRVHQFLAEKPRIHVDHDQDHAWLPSLVTAVNKEEVTVILHSAARVPLTPDGDMPTPYCIMCVLVERTEGATKQSVLGATTSYASIQPTQYPSWEQVISVTTSRTNILDQVLVFEIGDSCLQELLISFKFPLCYLQPYHQYHLELTQTVRGQMCSLFLSVMRKLPTLSSDPSAFRFTALEVMLHKMEQTLVSSGSLIVLAKVVSDLYVYKDIVQQDVRNTTGVVMTTISFPNPHPASFSVALHGYHQGFPQISIPSRGGAEEVWKHSFLFTEPRDKATLFIPGSAVVLEFYQSSKAMQGHQWRLQDPIAHASILMDGNIYEQLAHKNGQLGMRVSQLPLQMCQMKTVDDTFPSIEVVIRLIFSEKPESLSSVSEINQLPRLSLAPTISDPCLLRKPSQVLTFHDRWCGVQRAAPDVSTQTSRPAGFWQPVDKLRPSYKKPESLSSVSEINQLPRLNLAPTISDPCLLRKPSQVLTFHDRWCGVQRAAPDVSTQTSRPAGFWQPVDKLRPSYKPLRDGELPPHDALENILPEYKYIFVDPEPKTLPPGESTANQTRHPVVEAPKVEKEDLERTTMTLLDYQMRELEKYRTAVKTMGNDIVALRHEIQSLEADNSKLRLELEHYNDTTALLREDNLDIITKPELATRYVMLKRKLNSVTVELGEYRDRVCELQNNLITKNDREKELLQISDAHQSQQETMLRLQQKVDKCKRLEDACRKQEKVIEKMEKLIGSSGSKGSGANDALAAENRRLRSELEDLKDQNQAVNSNQERHEEEELKLYSRLEKAESRIRSLESQLADNARQWAREKSELMSRLREAEHGLAPPIYKEYPKIQPRNRFEPQVEPRKYSRAPPGATRQVKGHRCTPKLEPLYLR